jgi:DNA-binding transcriptional regulator YiaG
MPEELTAAYRIFDGSPTAFAEIMRRAVEVRLRVADLAKMFEVSESTIMRWSRGEVRPRPRIQRTIVAHVGSIQGAPADHRPY